MVVIPSVLETLKKLKKQGLFMVILSAHPHSPKEAVKVLKAKIDHFKIADFFDSYHASEAHPDQKGGHLLPDRPRHHIELSIFYGRIGGTEDNVCHERYHCRFECKYCTDCADISCDCPRLDHIYQRPPTWRHRF